MVRRPDSTHREEILNQDDLKALGNSLARLSASAVRDFYDRAYRRCRITGRDFRPARAIQELVQAWKQLRRWRN